MANASPTSGSFGLEAMQSQALQAWKKQFDAALGLVEAMTEGATKMHEKQLEASTDAHANAAAAQQAAAGATNAVEIGEVEAHWAAHNMEQAAAYWRALFETALETNACMLKGVCGPWASLVPGQPIDVEKSKNELLGAVDDAYKRWLELVAPKSSS